ncbi:MAG TPA: hypothetical protein VLN58_13850 [Verrucomicrobiae bacterium]|nr:hypothetical protein [Verrucomicrobiae bacterium]
MALKDAPIVKMLSFDEKEAYNHDRPISSLVRTQLLHLHTAENLWLSPEDRTNININNLHTEKQASEYIQQVTALLHRHGKRREQAQQAPSPRKSKKAKKVKPARPRKKKASASGKKSAAKKRGSRR